MPIYLIRHGQSEFNVAYDIDSKDPKIHDAALTPKGIEQARSLRLKVQGLGIQNVIVSPLTRALQTAGYIFGENQKITVDAGAREQLSHSCDVGRSPNELAKNFPGLKFDHLPNIWWHTGVPNDLGYTIETQDVFAPRMVEFAADLAKMTPRPIAVVGHGNAFRELVGYDMKNCEIAQYNP